MLRDALELEGLLMLADSRDGEISEIAVTAIREKIDSLAANAVSLKAIEPEQTPEEEVITPATDDIHKEDEIEETVTIEESDDSITDDTNVEYTEETDTSKEDYTESEYETIPEPGIYKDSDTIEAVTETDSDTEVVAEPEFKDEPAAEEPESEEKITVDEAYIRNKSKDLSNAFSINDMFRFRRELFGNNAAEMTDAINLVDAMQSYDEAEDYFYNELGWDKDSEEVTEFMTIIKNHFI